MKPPRYVPVLAIAAACLLLGSTGGAVAGSLITGKQIKDNTVTTKDIRNKTLTTKDLAPKTVKALRGKPGAKGDSGRNAWDTIPSGTTVTGRFYQYNRSGATTTQVAENVNLPATAPAPPTALGFGPDGTTFTTDDPACTGTYQAPTAAPGHVCVYLGGTQGINTASVNAWVGVEQQTHAFYLFFGQTTPDSVYEFWGNWAYTAP